MFQLVFTEATIYFLVSFLTEREANPKYLRLSSALIRVISCDFVDRLLFSENNDPTKNTNLVEK